MIGPVTSRPYPLSIDSWDYDPEINGPVLKPAKQTGYSSRESMSMATTPTAYPRYQDLSAEESISRHTVGNTVVLFP